MNIPEIILDSWTGTVARIGPGDGVQWIANDDGTTTRLSGWSRLDGAEIGQRVIIELKRGHNYQQCFARRLDYRAWTVPEDWT